MCLLAGDIHDFVQATPVQVTLITDLGIQKVPSFSLVIVTDHNVKIHFVTYWETCQLFPSPFSAAYFPKSRIGDRVVM